MAKISCNVSNCSHYEDGVCYSNRVNIGGKGASTCDDTCCGSFLDKAHYTTLTNNTNGSGSCDCLVCEVETCGYNTNKTCEAPSISVQGNNVHLYSETFCDTFK